MIELRNSQNRLNIDEQSVIDLCGFLLENLSLGDCVLSVSLVGDEEMTSLNRQYFRKNRTTDVISFPMENEISNGILLGDIVVCVPQAVRSSNENNLPVSEELSLYLIHGILHLIGERDETSSERHRMEKKQNAILEKARKAGRLASTVLD